MLGGLFHKIWGNNLLIQTCAELATVISSKQVCKSIFMSKVVYHKWNIFSLSLLFSISRWNLQNVNCTLFSSRSQVLFAFQNCPVQGWRTEPAGKGVDMKAWGSELKFLPPPGSCTIHLQFEHMGGRGRWISLSLWSVWSAELVPGHLSWNKNNKIKKKIFLALR